jgi:O-acetyl-ADP-ribose deacetylase (regulator of RNase III)
MIKRDRLIYPSSKNVMVKITIIQWDITTQSTNAIVNAANSSLLWWWWVDWAIHRAWWSKILEECKKIRDLQYPEWLPIWEAVITTWWNLLAKYIIHTVWPHYYRNEKDWKELLEKAYISCLNLAIEKWIKSISFPSISTWAYACPIEECRKIAVSTVKEFTNNHPEIQEVRFVLHSEKDYKIYKQILWV